MSGFRTVVITKSAKLDYQMGFMVVRSTEIQKIYIGELSTLIIESTAVSLTAYLLAELVAHKVKVVFCDAKRNPISELIPCYGSHDSSIKIRDQIAWTAEARTSAWTRIVMEKIRNQATVLHKYEKKEENFLLAYLGQVELDDATNREGHAAKVYFNALFGKSFSRGDDSSINAALNYGYTVLLSCFNREIAACGYLTQLGLSHSNRFNPFNLGSDLMEPFRPVVDDRVLRLKPETFEKDEKQYMLEMLDEELTINSRKERLTNAIAIYVKSVFALLNNKGEGTICFFEL